MQTPSPQNAGTLITSDADARGVSAGVNAAAAMAPASIMPSPEHPSVDPAPTANQVAWGKWIHKHRAATEGVGGFLGYQIIRNSLAAIPYGIATAAVWVGMERAAEYADARVNKAGAQGAVPHASATAKLMRSPLRDVAMIAAGFTLFRGTLKVVRYMKERLFDPNHTEEQSIHEVQHFKENLVDSLKEVAPAEIASTPTAAIALGIGRRFWDPQKYLEGAHGKQNLAAIAEHKVTGVFRPGFEGSKWGQIKRVFGRKGGYLQEAGIVAASFVPFFELGDRRYKDAQVARGIWLNDPTSLVRKSDEQAKAELQEGQALIGAVDTGKSHVTAIQNAMVRKSAESLHATGHLRPTDTPTLGCFVMRRVVPTFMGIGAYVAGKRLAYMGLGTIPEHYNKQGGFLGNLARIAVIEGAATSLFWLNASVIDKYEPWYDKTFKDSQAKPLTDQQVRKHYLELQARLDAKEQDRKAGVASVG